MSGGHAPGRPAKLAPGVMYMFSGRGGGVSAAPFDTMNLGRSVGDDPAAVTANRRLAAQACGVAPERLSWMHQVHGTAVHYAAAPGASAAGTVADGGEPPVADAMYTDQAGPVLVVQVADCGRGVDAGGGAADYRLENFGFHLAKLDATTCPVVFRPRGPAFNV